MRWADLREELLATPGVQEEIERLYPYEQVAFALNGLRAEMDMTQTEFGRLVGVPQSTVARLESGQQNPSVGTLKRIAEATGTELVIEFRRPDRGRRGRARRPVLAASSASGTRLGDRLAASPADE